MSKKRKKFSRTHLRNIALLACLTSTAAIAASFDCDDTKVPAETFICGNSTLSKLDDTVGALYRKTLAKASNDDMQTLIDQQRHWLAHTRNRCQKEVCFKHAYWMRLAELAYFLAPKSPRYAKESDKAVVIKKILASTSLRARTLSYPSFCRRMLADLKAMRNVRFVEPAVQAMSYEDPALEPWRARFESQDGTGKPLNFAYRFDPNIFSGDDVDTLMNEGKAYYGLPPYKIYALPPRESSEPTRYVFFSANEYGPTNREDEEPRVLHGAAFEELPPPLTNKSIFVTTSWVAENGREYDGIIEYRRRYFILTLTPMATKTYMLGIEFTDANATCTWHQPY